MVGSQRSAPKRRARVAALAAASLALVPFAAGSVPLRQAAEREPVAVGALGATGRLPEQAELSPEVLADVGSQLSLARHGVPSEVPISEITTGTGATAASGGTASTHGIPAAVLRAYRNAERILAQRRPDCGVTWSLLAAIGRVESRHAAGGRVDDSGRTLTSILGPRLDGTGPFAAIRDTDAGTLDGDPVWDRAVGPMQFIPSTWRGYAADGDGDGHADPHNIHDATVAAGGYLCAGGGDLRRPQDRARAVFRYNHSDAYVREVLTWAAAYAGGVVPTAGESGPTVLAAGGPVMPAGSRAGAGAPAPAPPTTAPGPDRVPDPGSPSGDGHGEATSPPPAPPPGSTTTSATPTGTPTTTTTATTTSPTSTPPVTTSTTPSTATSTGSCPSPSGSSPHPTPTTEPSEPSEPSATTTAAPSCPS